MVVVAARLDSRHHAAAAPSNNKMQQTRSGHSRWRPSLLILVFYRPRPAEGRRREAAGLETNSLGRGGRLGR